MIDHDKHDTTQQTRRVISDFKDLMRHMLRADPSKRMRMSDVKCSPWLNQSVDLKKYIYDRPDTLLSKSDSEQPYTRVSKSGSDQTHTTVASTS